MPRLPDWSTKTPSIVWSPVVTGVAGCFSTITTTNDYPKGLPMRSSAANGASWRIVGCPTSIHALIETPEANLRRGMQHWLSGYANWHAKRNRRTGHLFQGRYEAFPVEDEWSPWREVAMIQPNGSWQKDTVW